jgi:hypothetical protein
MAKKFITRTKAEILELHEELFEKIWYNRYWNRILSGDKASTEIEERAAISALIIEAKYGRDNLIWDDFDWGMLNGKLSVIRWLTGDEWEESLDT